MPSRAEVGRAHSWRAALRGLILLVCCTGCAGLHASARAICLRRERASPARAGQPFAAEWTAPPPMGFEWGPDLDDVTEDDDAGGAVEGSADIDGGERDAPRKPRGRSGGERRHRSRRKDLLALTTRVQNLRPSASTSDVGALVDGAGLVANNFTELLVELKRRNRWKQAVMVADYVRGKDLLQLNALQYNLLISACARPSPRRALALFRQMQNCPRVDADVVSYNAAIKAAAQARDPMQVHASSDVARRDAARGDALARERCHLLADCRATALRVRRRSPFWSRWRRRGWRRRHDRTTPPSTRAPRCSAQAEPSTPSPRPCRVRTAPLTRERAPGACAGVGLARGDTSAGQDGGGGGRA